MRKRLSVIIPAYNEEKNIEATVKSVLRIIPKYCTDYEIIAINDSSKDDTGKIIDKLASKNKKIKPIHNKRNVGFGGSYWRGVKAAKFEYCIMVWGENGHTDQSVHKILSLIGKFDVVIPYYTNMNTRSLTRRLISIAFTKLANILSGYSIKYYNGTTLYKTRDVKNFRRRSAGFGFQAEVLSHVLGLGSSYAQVGVLRNPKTDESTTAFKVKNIINVGKSILWLTSVRLFKMDWTIFLAILLMTIVTVHYLKVLLKFDYYFYSDEAIYAILSERFLKGDLLNAFNPYWNSGFPVFTIPFYFITKTWENAQLLLSIVSSILLIPVIYFLLRRFSKSVALVASFITAFSIVQEKLIFWWGATEPLYVLLYWVSLAFAWRALTKKTIKSYLLAGIFFGITYFVRTEVIFAFTLFIFLVISSYFLKRKPIDRHIFSRFRKFLLVAAIAVYLRFKSERGIFFALIIGIIFLISFLYKPIFSTFKMKFRALGLRLIVLIGAFLIVNLPYTAAISMQLQKPTLSGKYAYYLAGHPFKLEPRRYATFAQEVWSIDYPNFQSPFYDSQDMMKKLWKNLDNSLEATRKKINTNLSYYGFDNMFSNKTVLLAGLGILLVFLYPGLVPFILFLAITWAGNFFYISFFMEVGFRYLAFSYPILYILQAIAVVALGNLLAKRYKALFPLTLLVFAVLYLRQNIYSYNYMNPPRVIRNQDQKVIGEWLKDNNINLFLGRTEGVQFYANAKMVYLPAAPPEIIVDYARAWGVEYILARPVETSWDYMRAIASPEYSHPDLTLVHSFDDRSLVWKVNLSEEDKTRNLRTGYPKFRSLEVW